MSDRSQPRNTDLKESKNGTHLELAHHALTTPVAEVFPDGKVVKVVRAFVRLNERPDLFEHFARHAPGLFRLHVGEEIAPLGLGRPEVFAGADDRPCGRIKARVCRASLLERFVHRRARFRAEEDVRRQGVLVLALVADSSRVKGALHTQDRPDADSGREEAVDVVLDAGLVGFRRRVQDELEREDVDGGMDTRIRTGGASERDLSNVVFPASEKVAT